MLTQSSIYKEYLDLMDTEAWKQYIKLKIYKLQQIFRPRIITDASTSEKLYNGEIKMYFYLAMVGSFDESISDEMSCIPPSASHGICSKMQLQ